MMKWPKKKTSSSSSSITSSPSLSSSSSHAHLISHVFPMSWLSKFKQTIDKPASRMPKTTQKTIQTCEKSNQKLSSKQFGSYRDSRFYTKNDDDAFWRLSFGVKDGEISKRERLQKVSEKVGVDEDKKNESLERTYRRIIEATSELQRELEQVRFGDDEYRNSVDNKKHLHVMQVMGNGNEEWQQMKDAKKKEFMSKNDIKQRKSFHVSRDFGTSGGLKMRARSPRTPSKTETCKVKALEKMKRAKMKKKMKEIEVEKEAVSGLESFAVVKCSCNPQQDFRESMTEMIVEKRIRKPEQLEELLACYLTLNADEHHDVIIKVFRQVWRDLEQVEFNQKLSADHECCCCTDV